MLNKYLSFFSCCVGALMLAVGANASDTSTMNLRIGLQAAMQSHIDRSLVDGSYLALDPASGEVNPLYPVTAHPMILQMGEYYVLCSDFRDVEGNKVEMDFYAAKRDGEFVIFRAEVENRALIKRMMSEGKIERLK